MVRKKFTIKVKEVDKDVINLLDNVLRKLPFASWDEVCAIRNYTTNEIYCKKFRQKWDTWERKSELYVEGSLYKTQNEASLTLLCEYRFIYKKLEKFLLIGLIIFAVFMGANPEFQKINFKLIFFSCIAILLIVFLIRDLKMIQREEQVFMRKLYAYLKEDCDSFEEIKVEDL